MRLPSAAQAALLALIAEHDEREINVEWCASVTLHVTPRPYADSQHHPHRARLYVEVVDRVKHQSRFDMADGWTYAHRLVTVQSCLGRGWLSGLHQRHVEFPADEYTQRQTWHLRQLDLTEDGVIALGLWRERKLKAPPVAMPSLSAREREIAELALRAHELGYALCARKPARAEARRMRDAGWFTRHGCWVANNATGLVASPMAVVELRPDAADIAAPDTYSRELAAESRTPCA